MRRKTPVESINKSILSIHVYNETGAVQCEKGHLSINNSLPKYDWCQNRFYYKTKQKYFILSFLIYQSIFTYSAHGYSTSRGAFLRFDRHFVTGDQIRTDTSFV